MRKPHINKIHIILELLGYIMLMLSLVYAIVMINTIEGEIPTHYNEYGEVDSYGSPTSLLILPIVMLSTCLIITACLHFLSAKSWNTGFKLNPARENIVLADFGYMMASMVLEIGLFTMVATYFFTQSGTVILGASFALVAAMAVSVAVFFVKAYIDNKAD